MAIDIGGNFGISPLAAGISSVGLMLLGTLWVIDFYITRTETRLALRLEHIEEMVENIHRRTRHLDKPPFTLSD